MLASCASGTSGQGIAPQLAAAQPGTLSRCEALTGFSFAGTTITSASLKADGEVKSGVGGVSLSMPAHCVVTGAMNPRTGVDGKPYAIRFEMRLPVGVSSFSVQ